MKYRFTQVNRSKTLKQLQIETDATFNKSIQSILQLRSLT